MADVLSPGCLSCQLAVKGAERSLGPFSGQCESERRAAPLPNDSVREDRKGWGRVLWRSTLRALRYFWPLSSRSEPELQVPLGGRIR